MTAHLPLPVGGSLADFSGIAGSHLRSGDFGSSSSSSSHRHPSENDIGQSLPPEGFPAYITGPSTWSGSGAGRHCANAHVVTLDQTGTKEVDTALRSFLSLGLDGDEITRERFPLPQLQAQLEQCAHEVHRGSGICVIRGLDPKKYNVEDNLMLFLGIASYIGDQRGIQSSKGLVLSHVTDDKTWTAPREKRHGIHTNEGLPYHTDMGCDILSWHVRSVAESGGYTCVAPVSAIYNDLMTSNPSALHVLAQSSWPVQISRKESMPFILSPLLEYHSGKLMISMDPARLGPHPRAPNSVPHLLPEQKEALSALQQTAQKHQLRLQAQAGDMIFINNWSLLHAREPYVDGQASRHLIRLWLRNQSLAWDVPASMKVPWDAAFGERASKVMDRQYPVIPMPEHMEAKYGNGTAAFVMDEEDHDNPEDAGPSEEM
ncbi:Clavaminate synthase-like protein [Xylariomycetidae sp. FL2044]|nr:Clavaminate synthase-like protein [Xylariomycetidae sp. FL2044]